MPHNLLTLPFTAPDLGERLYASLRDTGFVIVTDHGIDLSQLHRAYAQIEAFFALPEAQKRRFVVGADGQRGYTPFGREHAKDSPAPDLKEFFHVGRESIAPNIWPSTPAHFRASVEWLYTALDELGLALLDALEAPLAMTQGSFRTMAKGGNSVLRLLHYPPIGPDADPASIRAGAHEDINLITLLVSASASGLQLFIEGEWREVNAPANAVIVDTGDMLARITHHHLPATTHRVVNPTGPNVSRYSMPFFLHPKPQAILSCLPQFCDGSQAPDITGEDFLKQRLAEIGLS
jgi:isopenicillin N synthase-like dioxygenase